VRSGRRLSLKVSDGVSGCLSTSPALYALAALVAILLSLVVASRALAAEEHGYITGKVTAARTGDPIGGVNVCAVNLNGVGPWGCTTTDGSGGYTASVFESGKYEVQFTSTAGSGYITRVYYNDKYSASEEESVSVTLGATTSGIDAQLQEGGQILGTVTNATTREPVDAVEACVGADGVECALTNTRGEYAISGLPPGEYQVMFGFGYGGNLGEVYVTPEYYKNIAFTSFSSEPAKISVPLGGVAAGIDQELKEFSRISGKVINSVTKAPVAGIRVHAYSESGSSVGQVAETNSSGEYTISHVADRSEEYYLDFEVPTNSGINYFSQSYGGGSASERGDPVRLALGDRAFGIDAELEEAGQISGKVTDGLTKDPLGEITVCARSKIVYEARCAWTNTNGEYAIAALPSGEYEVSFYTNANTYFPQYYDGKASESEGRMVSVATGHATTGIDAELEQVVDGVITGTVRDNSSEKPIEGIEACAYEVSEREELFASCATTNVSGEYTVRGLAGGKYLVEFYAPSGSGLNYAPQYYDNRLSAIYAEEVPVTSGRFTSGIDAQLEKSGNASGRVISAESGEAIEGIEVCFFARNEELVGCLLTNSNGEYVTPRLARGEYKVAFASAFGSGLNYVGQYYGGSSTWDDAQIVSIQAGVTSVGIDAQMSEGGRLAGRVANSWTGEPIKGLLTCALARYSEFGVCAATNGSGEYVISGLGDGEYKIMFDGGKSYVVQYYPAATSLAEAQTVSVAKGATHDGIDAVMEPTGGSPPSNLSPPDVSGTPMVGDTLDCSSGSWAGNPTPTYSYVWLRNGVPTTSASAESDYTVRKADEGDGLACEVTAANNSGTQSVSSISVEVPASSTTEPPTPRPPVPVIGPTSPPTSASFPAATLASEVAQPLASTTVEPVPSKPTGVLTVSGSKALLSADTAEVSVKCGGGGCRGSIELIVEVVTRRKDGRKTVFRKQTLVLARGSLSLAEGRGETVRLHLTGAGRARVARAKHQPLAAKALLSGEDGKTTATRVLVS
jgi:hypothetical protein